MIGLAGLVLSILSAGLATIPYGFITASPLLAVAVPLTIVDLLNSKKKSRPTTVAVISFSYIALAVVIATAWLVVVDIKE